MHSRTKLLCVLTPIILAIVLLCSRSALVVLYPTQYPDSARPFNPTPPEHAIQELQHIGKSYRFVPMAVNLSRLLLTECNDSYVVPNIVHYIVLGNIKLRFDHYICILSVYKYIKPCYIVFHGDALPWGPWWDTLMTNVSRVLFSYSEKPLTVFGQTLNYVEHSADILRIHTLLNYGGIYLDLDMVALRSFDLLRSWMFTVDAGRKSVWIPNCVIIASKHSPFLKMWMLAYHQYQPSWGYNSMELLRTLTKIFPTLAHVTNGTLNYPGTSGNNAVEEILWHPEAFSVHLLSRSFINKNMELKDILTTNTTFAMLSRHTLYGDISERPGANL